MSQGRLDHGMIDAPSLGACVVAQFFSIDPDRVGRFDPQPDLVASEPHHGDLDATVNNNRFVKSAAQNEHGSGLRPRCLEEFDVGYAGLSDPKDWIPLFSLDLAEAENEAKLR